MDKVTALELIKSAGLTQLDVVSALKMSPATLRRYLEGRPILRRTKAELDRYFEDLRLQRSSSEDNGPEAA